MDKYEVVESFSSEEFAKAVTSRLRQGWIIQGGLRVVHIPYGVKYYQSMVLPFKTSPVKVKYSITEEDKITFTPGLMGFPETGNYQ
jgi:hypothetical protein